MALPMARPMKINGIYYFKQRVPKDLVAVFGREQVKISLRTKDPVLAKRLQAEKLDEFNERWARLRAGPQPSQRLNSKQIDALAGEIYRDILADAPKDDRGAIVRLTWVQFWSRLRDGLEPDPGKRSSSVPEETGEDILEEEIGRYVDWALGKRELVCDKATRRRLLLAAGRAGVQAAEQVGRECRGDWRPDPDAARFPALDLPKAAPPPAKKTSIDEIWQKIVPGLAPKTQSKYRRHIDDLLAFAGTKDLAKVTRDQVKAWRDDVLGRDGVQPRTVERDWLGSVKAVFSFAVRDEILETSPAAGVMVQAARRQKGAQMRGFTNEETSAILRAALRHVGDPDNPKLAAAIRWVPWILAYTGARVNEITQLTAKNVRKVDGYWSMLITFKDGAQKTMSEREVPLHEDLIRQGFIGFVERHGPDEPLFHNPRQAGVERKTLPGEANAARVGEWVRSLGVGAESVGPNHGWRHRFKTEGRAAKMDWRNLDAIQGHLDTSQGFKYGDFPPRVTGPEIEKLPRIVVDGA